jgi:N-acetylneuraminic acid mutarotase
MKRHINKTIFLLFVFAITNAFVLFEKAFAQGTWTKKADFGGNVRGNAIAFSIYGKGYIGTGYGVNYYKDFWEYDPTNDEWTQKAAFGGTARSSATAFAIGGKGYVGTGNEQGVVTPDFWEYDPSLNSWIQKATLNPSRSGAIAFTIGSKGYIAMGDNGAFYFPDLWEYDPALILGHKRQILKARPDHRQ